MMETLLPSIEEYLLTRGIRIDPYKSKGGHDRAWVRCPFHAPDDDPSFYFSRRKNVWRCPVCCEGGGVKRLICLLEFGGRTDRETWREVSRRCEELVGVMGGGGVPPALSSRLSRDGCGQEEATRLSARQLILLDQATMWWHDHLCGQIREARLARDYLILRGVSCHTMMAHHQIGYAPKDPDGSYARSLIRVLSCTEEEAIALGLLSRREQDDGQVRLRFQGRIMFSSCDHLGHTRYYQGRIVGAPSTTTRYTYLGAPLPKYPFSLPVEHPVIRGTVGTESPMGPLVLAGYDIAGVATCGAGGIPSWVLARFAPPFYWAQDTDAPKRRTIGTRVEDVFPGEEQATATIRQCHLLGIAAYRVRPPAHTKGLDEWLACEGPQPLIDAIAAIGGGKEQKGVEGALTRDSTPVYY